MSALGAWRRALVVLLAISTALFAVGVIAEDSVTDDHAGEPASAVEKQHGEEAEEGSDARDEGDAAVHEETAAEPDHDDAGEDERLLGVDLESTPLVILAVAGGFGLALLAASRLGRVWPCLIGVGVVALLWAALDIREVVHQIDESRAGIAVLAAAVAALHVAAAGVAGGLGLDAKRS